MTFPDSHERNALAWCAALLQKLVLDEVINGLDIVTIDGQVETVADVLDAANDALEQKEDA